MERVGSDMATYLQIDWTGEPGFINPNFVLCAKCSKPLRNSSEARVGRPLDYCSDACKMRVYRQRTKALRDKTVKTAGKVS